jgi:hypothetical protein
VKPLWAQLPLRLPMAQKDMGGLEAAHKLNPGSLIVSG